MGAVDLATGGLILERYVGNKALVFQRVPKWHPRNLAGFPGVQGQDSAVVLMRAINPTHP